LLKRSLLKKTTCAERKQRKILQVVSRRIKKEKQKLLEEKRRLVEEKRLIRNQANKSHCYTSYNRKCGHANFKILITIKRHGKVIVSRLSPKFLRNYREECPICIAMKKRRKSLPKGSDSTHTLSQLVPWEEVFSDSSGKFRLKSRPVIGGGNGSQGPAEMPGAG
jgi:hypothetical protein